MTCNIEDTSDGRGELIVVSRLKFSGTLNIEENGGEATVMSGQDISIVNSLDILACKVPVAAIGSPFRIADGADKFRGGLITYLNGVLVAGDPKMTLGFAFLLGEAFQTRRGLAAVTI